MIQPRRYTVVDHKPFLGAYAKLREANVSFVMSVYPSVSPHGKLGSTGRILVKFDIECFSKICLEN
jgi:hypothetical protein